MRFAAGLLSVALATACSPQLPVKQNEAPVSAPLAADQLMDDTRILSADDMQGRQAGLPSGAMARAYVLKRFNEIGLAPFFPAGFEQPFPFKRRRDALEGVSLIGVVKGSSGSTRAMVVTAHYDHEGELGGLVFNGADDNASGVATLLMIAKSLKERQPKHDVIIAALDAEEDGELGAKFMVPKLPLERITVAVNFDMMARSDRNELYAAGAFHFPWLKPRLQAIAAKAPVKLLLGHDDPALGPEDDWTGQSDHLAFHLARVPWVYLGVENHPDYHRPTDDFDRIPQDFFRRSAATAEAVVRAFDAELEAIATDAGR